MFVTIFGILLVVSEDARVGFCDGFREIRGRWKGISEIEGFLKTGPVQATEQSNQCSLEKLFSNENISIPYSWQYKRNDETVVIDFSNDDEKKMIQEIYNFVGATCGTEMISKLSSPYSAHLYQELQKTLKTELDEKEYENAKTASRFFDNVNLLDFSTPATLFSSHNVNPSKSAQQ